MIEIRSSVSLRKRLLTYLYVFRFSGLDEIKVHAIGYCLDSTLSYQESRK